MENEKGIVKLTRKQLYDEIWALSVAGVARKYNLNYGKLIATCKVENIGITGAIYKNLFKLNKNYDYLDEAINYYKKGFIIKNDYYNGENYSNCLLLKTQKPDLEVDEIEYLKFESKKVCREIISLLEENIRDNEINYWMYATLATCYLCLKDEKNYQKYEAEFLANTTIEWEIETYKNTIADTKKILMIE